MAQLTIKAKVELEKDALMSMQTRQELLGWAETHDISNRASWGRYKKALIEVCGISYDSLRTQDYMEKREALHDNAKVQLILFSDAKAKKDRFGICGPDREPVWYGKFFASDHDYNGEQSSGEMAAAKKAVWLASQVATRLGVGVALELRVDAEWLCWANQVDGSGGKAKELGAAARRLDIALSVVHIPGVENPADRWTVESGFMNWRDSIDHLVEQCTPKN